MLIMDNCSILHTERVKQACDDAGVKIQYLPPYLPDFNPIEEFFSKMKSWMKRKYNFLDRMSFKTFSEETIEACSGAQHARGHFEHAGVDCGSAGAVRSHSEDDT